MRASNGHPGLLLPSHCSKEAPCAYRPVLEPNRVLMLWNRSWSRAKRSWCWKVCSKLIFWKQYHSERASWRLLDWWLPHPTKIISLMGFFLNTQTSNLNDWNLKKSLTYFILVQHYVRPSAVWYVMAYVYQYIGSLFQTTYSVWFCFCINEGLGSVLTPVILWWWTPLFVQEPHYGQCWRPFFPVWEVLCQYQVQSLLRFIQSLLHFILLLRGHEKLWSRSTLLVQTKSTLKKQYLETQLLKTMAFSMAGSRNLTPKAKPIPLSWPIGHCG